MFGGKKKGKLEGRKKEKKIVYKGRKEKGRKEKQRKEIERRENRIFHLLPQSRKKKPNFHPPPFFVFVASFPSKLVTQGWVRVRSRFS